MESGKMVEYAYQKTTDYAVCIAKPGITLVSAAWLLGCFRLIAGVSKLVFTFRTHHRHR